jgi:hypothetical protein
MQTLGLKHSYKGQQVLSRGSYACLHRRPALKHTVLTCDAAEKKTSELRASKARAIIITARSYQQGQGLRGWQLALPLAALRQFLGPPCLFPLEAAPLP